MIDARRQCGPTQSPAYAGGRPQAIHSKARVLEPAGARIREFIVLKR